MIKNILLLLYLAMPFSIFAQEIERTKIAGEIHVPKTEDAEGISVYNISSQKGTITKADGTFEIEVAENDRIQITALQYQSFTVSVDKGIVDRKVMNIFLNSAVNQLEEVVVRPYDLTGNINVDVKKIPTYNVTKDWDLSYKNMEYGYDFEQDAQTAIAGNAAEDALNDRTLKNGANILGILGGVAQLLFPKGNKISIEEEREDKITISNNIQQRFSADFIEANFNIPADKAVDFLFFAQENGLDKDLLKPVNEMQLMEFLLNKSDEYKKRNE